MKNYMLFRKGLVQVGLVGMLVLMCSTMLQAQPLIVQNTGVPKIITSALNGFFPNTSDYIIVEPGGILEVGPGVVLNTDFIDINQGGEANITGATVNTNLINVLHEGKITLIEDTVHVPLIEVYPRGVFIGTKTILDMTGGSGQINLARGNGPSEGAVFEMSKSEIGASTDGTWNGIYVAGIGSGPNQQSTYMVAQAKLNECSITQSRYGICNYQQNFSATTGGGIIQVKRCDFLQNTIALDFQEALLTGSSGLDADASYVAECNFQDNGFAAGPPSPNMPACAVYAYRVNGLQLIANRFEFSGNIYTLPDPVCGIAYEEAGIKVESTSSPSQFSNLTYGVRRYSPGFGTPVQNQQDVSITYCTFTNCITGIYAAYTDRVKIIGNTVSMEQFTPFNPKLLIGIEIVQSADFKLRNNRINTVNASANSDTYGIYVHEILPTTGVFPSGEKIEYNTITNCEVAINLFNNMVNGDDGLYVLCNTMSNMVPSARDILSDFGAPPALMYLYGIAYYNSHDPSGVRSSAGNTFSNFPNATPQNFENRCRIIDYYDDGSVNPAGFTPVTLLPGGLSGINLLTLYPYPPYPPVLTYTCNPDSVSPRPAAAYNQLGTDKPVLSKGQNPVVAPNPSHDGIFKLSGFNASRYIVTDVFGRNLASGKLTAEVNTLDLSSFAVGTYILTVQSEGKSPATYKLLRQ